MSREIKFRYYVLESNVRGYYIYSSQRGFQIRGETTIIDGFAAVNTSKLQQFVGLKDKNGKEIYEGDILKQRGGSIIAITYDYAGFASNYISGPCYQNQISYLSDCNMCGTLEQSEVIGNIFENPDLTND